MACPDTLIACSGPGLEEDDLRVVIVPPPGLSVLSGVFRRSVTR